MGKNPDLSPTKRATIVEMQNQIINFKDIANEINVSQILVNKLFMIERNLTALIHYQSQEDQELPAPDWIEQSADHQKLIA